MRNSLLILLFCTAGLTAQQWKHVDFTRCDARVAIDAGQRAVKGTVTYEFIVKSMVDTISIDAINMQFYEVVLNEAVTGFKTTDKAIKLFKGFRKGKNKLTIGYSATPRQTLYFTGTGDGLQIWSQGQGKYTSHWLPSFDDVNEKVVFNMSIGFSEGYTVLSNGVLKGKWVWEGNQYWKYTMDKPMSSYLVMLAIGKFGRQDARTASGVPLEWYYAAGDERKVEPTYRHSRQMFDFLEKEIGVAYPWKVYRQVPVRDFLYAGMENTTATVFAQDFVVDSIGFNDRNYMNVNAHELAHQWFGNLVTARSGRHHWLQEGFATYYALLAERSIFGDDYFHWQLHDMALDLEAAAKTDTVPVMNERASSLSFYKKGAWALHILREEIGADAFRKAVKSYLKKHAFSNVDTDQFLAEVAKVTRYDLATWKKQWLETAGFPMANAQAYLRKNRFMQQYFALDDMASLPKSDQLKAYLSILNSDAYYPLKEEVVFRTAAWPFPEREPLIRSAMQTNDVKVRQAVARTMQGLPKEAFSLYRSLLEDRSYITREIALNMLYGLFPEYRAMLLNATSDDIGMNDRNLRILWLTLALSTEGYRVDEKPVFYDELIAYAGPAYEGNTRQNALEKLLYLDPNDTNALRLLIGLLTHHRWQTSKYGRDTIRTLIRKDTHLKFYRELLLKLDPKGQAQLERLLPTEGKS